MKMRLTKRLLILPLLLVGVLLCRIFWKATRYEVPAGFKGWLLIRWNQNSCPPLPRRGIYLVVAFRSSGTACTSNPRPPDLTYTTFEYVYANGAHEELALNHHGKSGTQAWLVGYDPENQTDQIFVGDEAELNRSGRPPLPPLPPF